MKPAVKVAYGCRRTGYNCLVHCPHWRHGTGPGRAQHQVLPAGPRRRSARVCHGQQVRAARLAPGCETWSALHRGYQYLCSACQHACSHIGTSPSKVIAEMRRSTGYSQPATLHIQRQPAREQPVAAVLRLRARPCQAGRVILNVRLLASFIRQQGMGPAGRFQYLH